MSRFVSTQYTSKSGSKFCLVIDTSVNDRTVTATFKVYCTTRYPYSSYNNTMYCAVGNNILINNVNGKYPNSDAWASVSENINGTTYKGCYTVTSGSDSVGAGGGTITSSFTDKWGSYSATYVPKAGTYSISGSDTIGAISIWNDINVYSPSGVQDYESGFFDLYISANNTTYTNLTNEKDTTQPYGTYFEVYNIRPYTNKPYTLDRVTGYDSTPNGRYRKTFDTANEEIDIYMKYASYYLDLNGQLDGVDSGSLGVYGKATVTANGSTSSNVTDYYQAHPYDKSYSITNITANSGYQYDGLASGSAALSGTIGTGKNVRLKFSTKKPSALAITRTASTTTSISGSVSATGLNISNYTLYYKKASASSYTSKSLGTTTAWSLTGLDADTNYNIYLSVTNPGGTTTTSSSPVTFSTTLTDPSIATPIVSDLLPFSCTITATSSITPSRTLNYRISTDNGTTWSAYQVSNVFNLTGLSEETTYNVKVQVKAIHTGTNASDTTATSATLVVVTPADQAKVRIKKEGQWVKGKMWYKKNGEWIKAKKVYIKKDGEWVIGYNYEN